MRSSSPRRIVSPGGRWTGNGFRIIPAAGDAMGNDIITANYRYYDADLLLTLCDIFKLAPSVKQLAEMNVAHWVPVDCDPLGKGDLSRPPRGNGNPGRGHGVRAAVS